MPHSKLFAVALATFLTAPAAAQWTDTVEPAPAAPATAPTPAIAPAPMAPAPGAPAVAPPAATESPTEAAPAAADPDTRTRSRVAFAIEGLYLKRPVRQLRGANDIGYGYSENIHAFGGLFTVDVTLTPPHRFSAAVRVGLGGITMPLRNVRWARTEAVTGDPGVVASREFGTADSAIAGQIDLVGRMTTGRFTLGIGARFAAFVFPVSGEKIWYGGGCTENDVWDDDPSNSRCQHVHNESKRRDPLHLLGGQGFIEAELGLTRDRRISLRWSVAFGRPRLSVSAGLAVRL